ncbi:hypothetical protein HNV11_11400 [Spirosoma taeanense]|uniref:Response regulatory domain-containing protein n=1 Tax=Spirosoma taeanense TaxID=2735870 RepID=A0A6M5Y9P4_9BACT|nr:hypothetical protein [Spirosoma taeanense]QJW89941.1 hypothetical protein HNV11_11400 [Spirosoma taeanense]
MRNLPSKTILVIENDRVHQEYISSFVDEDSSIGLIIKEDIRSAITYLETIQRNHFSLPGILLVNFQDFDQESSRLFDELKKRDLRGCIPVVAVSDTDEKNRIDAAYDQGVASYIVKPTEEKEWHSCITVLIRYWFNEVTLPNYSIVRKGF